MSLSVEIDSVDVSEYVQVSSVSITDSLNTRNTATLRLVGDKDDLTVLEGDEIEILDGTTTLFFGSIFSSDESLIIGTDHKEVVISAVDLNELADRKLVAELYEDELVEDIVDDLVTTYLAADGVTATSVDALGVTIEKAVWGYVPLSSALDELGALVGASWYIDYDGDLHFFSRETNAAPTNFTDANRDYAALSVTQTREGYRNSQYIRAGKDETDERTESFVGDGTVRTWTLSYECAHEPTVKVDTVTKTVGIRGVEQGFDFYWNKGDKQITQDSGGTELTSGNDLDVTYIGLFPLLLQAEDATAIAERISVEGGTGVYEAIEDAPEIDKLSLAIDKAEAILRREARIRERVKIATDETGFRAGQLMTIELTAEGLSGEYLIEDVRIVDVENTVIRSELSLVNGEALGGWTEFFRMLLKSTRDYVIRESEVLSLLRRFDETVTLTDTLSESDAAAESRIGYAQIGFSEVTT